MKSTAPGPNTFDRNELLRQFDELQSIKCDKTDIVAQAMELSSIPTDMNNNSDIVSQAMQMSNISSDIVMDFWLDCWWNVGSEAKYLCFLNKIHYMIFLCFNKERLILEQDEKS